ncbi:3-keto-5-aminohexanoate cleavage protein [Streptomyces sp. NPDC046866]|uniref:3-keto-5-aminohexanoate cleavage protein n=1 Tax=Streptomyces sp. NPDC046866 TaxID=3154921 RepID=UPI0034523265
MRPGPGIPRIQASLNGTRGAGDGPAVPLSPGDVVEAARGAVAAGAAELLVHPRTPCGRESLSPGVVGPLLEALRGAGVSVPLSVCASIAAEPDPAGRAARVRSWTVLPDRAAVRFTEPGAGELARSLLARGVAVDAVLPWPPPAAAHGGVPERAVLHGLTPFLRRSPGEPAGGWLRVVVESSGKGAEALGRLRRLLPGVALVLVGREGAAWPVLRLAARCGAAVRIGVGDVLHLPDGRPASSTAALVAAARAEAAALDHAGPSATTPTSARNGTPSNA